MDSVLQESNLIGTKVGVLDMGWIELIDLMPYPASGVSPDMAVVNAARVSFMKDSKGPDKDKKLLFYMMRHRHTSPFEQVEFKFRVRAPLVTWWQWVRHRTQSFNFQSGRYTEFEENDFYKPSEWRQQSLLNRQGSDGNIELVKSLMYDKKLQDHYESGFKLYEEALKDGMARELARLFLPGFSVYYTAVVKVDAHNLMHFLKLRMATEAQYEIRVYADAIYKDFFAPAMPWTAEAYDLYRAKE